MIIDKMVIATHNAGKIKEIKEMLEPLGVEVFSAGELRLPDVEETGVTFEENARLKADTLAEIAMMPCLADDSGLCIDALDGRPGVYSARYAPNRDFGKGMEMILDEMKGVEDRSAHFACVLALAVPGLETKVFEGRVDGVIGLEKRGDNGFGYDPIFMPEGMGVSFAEMKREEKAKISHRGRAFVKLVEYLNAK